MRRFVAVVTIALLSTGCGGGGTSDDTASEPQPVADADGEVADDGTSADADEPTGGADDGAAADEQELAGSVTFTGTDDLTWEPSAANVPAGLVEITLVCGGDASHSLLIEGINDGRPVAGCLGGAETTKQVPLDAGTYTVQCTIPGHYDMTGSLTVG